MGTILQIFVYTSKTLHIMNLLALPSESKGFDPLKLTCWRPRRVSKPSHNVSAAGGGLPEFLSPPKSTPGDPKVPLKGCNVRPKVILKVPKLAQKRPPNRPTGMSSPPRWALINMWQAWYKPHIGGESVIPFFSDLRRLRLDPSLSWYGRFLTSFRIFF